MKKTLLIITAAVFLMYCKSKKETTATAAAPAASNETILEIANKRWANTTQTELTEGKTIFENKCTACHDKKKIETRTEKNWLHEIDDMSPKAKLSADEKLKLTKYILSFREANAAK